MQRTIGLAVLLAAGLALPAAVAAGGSAAPSFDCSKASLPDEKAICADPELAAIDVLIAQAFKDFEPAYGGDKKAIARALIADRNRCKDDRACIAVVLDNALQTVGAVPSWVEDYSKGLIGHKALLTAAAAAKDADQPLPRAIGQCAVTHIVELTTRFGEGPLQDADANAGSLVTYTNEGAQVSYGHDDGLASSRVGDPVAVCLIAIPRDCPAGDERGRVYYGVDLTIGGSWVLPDSQHMCGGA
jgi:uncharacterized protein